MDDWRGEHLIRGWRIDAAGRRVPIRRDAPRPLLSRAVASFTRTCAAQGCTARIADWNRSGVCDQHRHSPVCRCGGCTRGASTAPSAPPLRAPNRRRSNG